MTMLLLLLCFVIVSSSAWNCTTHHRYPSTSIFSTRSMINQCEIILEYQSTLHDEHVICTSRSRRNDTDFDSTSSSSVIHRTLRMISCSLVSFKPVSSFEYLDLTNNSLSTFHLHRSSLNYLRLDHNPRLKEIFFNNEALLGLSLRYNIQLELISLPSTLIELDLTGCQLDHVPSLVSLKHLQWLSLAENRLEYLPELDPNLPLEYLNLSFNQLISIDAFQFHPPFAFILDLQGNPVRCDSNLFCAYDKYCPDECSCCDFEACDCHLICPNGCRCDHDRTWHEHRVTCRSLNRTDLNDLFFPSTMTEFNYNDSPMLKEISSSELFLGKTDLRRVDLSRNNLQTVEKHLFCPSKQIQEINLSDNPKLRMNLSCLDEYFRCLNDLQLLLLSSEQIDLNDRLALGWTIDLHPSNSNLLELHRSRRVLLQSAVISSSPSLAFSSSHLMFLLCLLSIFLLVFLCFSVVLLCTLNRRRRTRATPVATDSLYEQLPSFTSDLDQPFLPPALPPRRHFPCSTANSGVVLLYGNPYECCSSNLYQPLPMYRWANPMICTCAPKTIEFSQ